MIFNRKQSFFVFLFCFFSFSCGLRIRELAPDIPEYYLSSPSGVCSQLDYKKVFMDYFFANEFSSEKVSKAIGCISFKIEEIRDLINHDFLDKQQTVNVLNQDFIQAGNMKPIADNILDPEYFYNYVSIKNSLIQLMDTNFEKDYLSPGWICRITPSDKNIISKKEANILISFLSHLSEMFSSVEEDAQAVFQQFFKKYPVSIWDLQNSDKILTDFSSFLSNHLSRSFPGYSLFLRDQIREGDNTSLRESIAPLLEMLSLPLSLADRSYYLRSVVRRGVSPKSVEAEVSIQGLKYMMLNVYIMQAFFQVYDLNQDLTLSSQELTSLSCLVTPLVSVLISSQLKEEWEIIQSIYNPTAISHYIINYQELPSERILDGGFWGFWWYRVNQNPDELEGLSYTRVSRLVSLLFSEFFDKIQFEEL